MQPKTRRQIFRQKALDKAFTADELDKVMQVTRPTGWLALLVMGVIIAAVLAWSVLGNLSIKVATSGVILDSASGRQRAVLFLSLANKVDVRPGMKVQITPAGFPQQQYGYLLGTVKEVGQYPLTTQNLVDVLKNDALVTVFSQGGPEIMVTVELEQDAGTGGYAWTNGRATQVSSGTLLVSNIIVDEKRPISLILPN